MPSVEFALMGPLQVLCDGEPVRVGGPRERAVLARLALDANRVISIDRLTDAVWDGTPPQSARVQIAICVSRLRRALGDIGSIATVAPGYLLRIDEHSCDVTRFTALAADARRARARGDRGGAHALLSQALTLWRGTPLADLRGLRSEAVRLEQLRLDAVETCAELELELGNHRQVVETLSPVVAENPLRERATALLMLAQYRSGRRACALGTYHEARQQLIDKIGLEPGPELRNLHEQVLHDAPGLSPSGERTRPLVSAVAPATSGAFVVPSQVPRPPYPFIERSALSAAMERALLSTRAGHGTVLLTGGAQVGKSTVGLHWAHWHIEEFPGGQLYADLRTEDGAPAPVGPVVDRFLRGLGVGQQAIPEDHAEKIALYRSVVSRRQLLVFLDNAEDSRQVLPLLPGGGQCRVLITSRHGLDDLVATQGAERLAVEPLDRAESFDLLAQMAGGDWVAAEPQHAHRIIMRADGNPHALRASAARLRAPVGEGSELVSGVAANVMNLDSRRTRMAASSVPHVVHR